MGEFRAVFRAEADLSPRTNFVHVDVERLARRLGRLAPNSLAAVLSVLGEMFAT